MDEESRAEIRETMKRERIRSWISILFVLAVVSGVRWLTVISCLLWLAYLLYCYRRAADRGGRITNAVVALLPAGFLIANLIMMIRG